MREQEPEREEASPPEIESWRGFYLVVLGELAVLVGLFHLLTRWAS